MRIHILAYLLLITGCVNMQAIEEQAVADAKGNITLNLVSASCGNLGDLTQSCDIWNGANKQIELNQQKVRIAGNQSGELILIMYSKDVCKGGRYCLTHENNKNYEIVKNELNIKKLKILKVNPLAIGNYIGGYLILTDGNAYSILEQYTNSIESD